MKILDLFGDFFNQPKRRQVMNMNAINSGEGIIFLKRAILMGMIHGEKEDKKNCPVCGKYKGINDLVCDQCFGRYGEEINNVIHNAFCEIYPQRYPNRKSVSLQFEIVDKFPTEELKITKEVERQDKPLDLKVSLKTDSPTENNFIEVVPGFFLYKDEIEKMGNNSGFFYTGQCPICKNFKEANSWVCPTCVEKHFLFKKFLIQYAIIRLPAHLYSLDGFICDREDENILLDVGVKFLRSTKEVFRTKERMDYLKVLLRYFPHLDAWKIPVASCIVYKVIFHALSIANGRLLFEGAPRDDQKKEVVHISDINPRDPEIIPETPSKAVSVSTENEELKEDRNKTLKEARNIILEIKDNLNEDPRAGKALAAFIFKKISEWEMSTGKKKPDRRDFFVKAPFSESFLLQLEDYGNCVLKTFKEIEIFFGISGEEILCEGLLNLKSVEEENIEVSDKEEVEIQEYDLIKELASELLGKIKINLREAPLVARALAAFICERAKINSQKDLAFAESIGISLTSFYALKRGGTFNQCLSVAKFDEAITRLQVTKEEAIEKGLRTLETKGDKELLEIIANLQKEKGIIPKIISIKDDIKDDPQKSEEALETVSVIEGENFVRFVQEEFSKSNLDLSDFCSLIGIPEEVYPLCFGEERIKEAPVAKGFIEEILMRLGKTRVDLNETVEA